MKRTILLISALAMLLTAVFGGYTPSAAVTDGGVAVQPSAYAAAAVSGATEYAPADTGLPQNAAADYLLTETVTYDNVRVYGRYRSTVETVRANWSNSGIEVRFVGTALTLKISCAENQAGKEPYMQVWVDGNRTERVRISGGTVDYAVAGGLYYGEHTVKALMVTESFNTPLEFLSMTVGSSAGTPKLLEPQYDDDALVFDVYGDSITAGYGTIPGYTEGYRTKDQDSSTTYAAHTVEHYGGDGTYMAISGWGCYQGWGNDMNAIIPRIWKQADRQGGEWDFSSRQADIVIISLGTNDAWFWTNEMPEQDFIDAYVAFMSGLREVYPEAYFLCVYGMMDETFRPVVEAAAAQFCAIDKIGATYIDTPNMNDDPTYVGSGGHPSGRMGEIVSLQMIEAIEGRYFGEWSTRLSALTDRLEALDIDGKYADEIAFARFVAEDHEAAGRNPKRVCSEIERLIAAATVPRERLEEKLAQTKELLGGETLTETERSVFGKLAAYATVALGKASAGNLEFASITEAVESAVAKIGDAEYFASADTGSDIISMTVSTDGEYYRENIPAKKGDLLNIKVVSAVPKEELEGKLLGDKYRTSRRGSAIDTASPVSESFENGVYEYIFAAECGSADGSVRFKAGEDTAAASLGKSPVGEISLRLMTESVMNGISGALITPKLCEVVKAAPDRLTKIAVISGGEPCDDLAGGIERAWESAFGRGSAEVSETAAGSTIYALYCLDGLLASEPELVLIDLSAGAPEGDAEKEAFECLLRKLLTAENAPAVICVGSPAAAGAYETHSEVSAYYGVPYINADTLIDTCLTEGDYSKYALVRADGSATPVAGRIATETVIYMLSIAFDGEPNTEGALPEVPLTAMRYEQLTLWTPDNITPTRITTFTETELSEGEWSSCWCSPNGRGTLKFTLPASESVAMIYKDPGSGTKGTMVSTVFGARTTIGIYFGDTVRTAAQSLYLGDEASGEMTLIVTFGCECTIYGILTGNAA